MIDLKSQIVICEDLEKIKDFLSNTLSKENLVIIENEELKVEDAKEAIRQAYISSEKEKYIVLIAKKFNIYSQNALLKIIEEPPKNVNFIIVTNSKSSLLPTIKSRLPSVNISKKELKDIDIDIKSIDLNFIYDFLQKNRKIEKNEAKILIENLLTKAIEEGYELREDEIDFFADSIRLLELNANAINILTTIFLMILDIKKR